MKTITIVTGRINELKLKIDKEEKGINAEELSGFHYKMQMWQVTAQKNGSEKTRIMTITVTVIMINTSDNKLWKQKWKIKKEHTVDKKVQEWS